MKVYEAGTSIEFNVPLNDEEGRFLSPSALSYRVFDDEGTEIQEQTNITLPVPVPTKVSLTISGATNTLDEGVTIGFRRVEIQATTASGIEKILIDYLLEDRQPFIVPGNSFLTYETALVVARMMLPLNGWAAATPETRKFALFRAYDQMKAFSYEMRYTDDSHDVLTLDELADEDYARLTTSQILDFRKAQLAQADYLLGGNPIEKDIQDGLQSSTIGEISQFYRPRPTLNLAICRTAIAYVGKYIKWGLKIGRA